MDETDPTDRTPDNKAAEAAERDKRDAATSKKDDEDALEEGLDESFPGSDAPASARRERKT